MLDKLLGISPTKIIIAVTVLAGIAAVGGMFWYVNSLQKKISESEENLRLANQNITVLSAGIETQQKAIDKMLEDVQLSKQANQEIYSLVQRQTAEVSELRNKFNTSSATGKERNFSTIAAKRPDSIQRVINNGSKEAARCIELATGAERTPAEISATKRSEINSLCPSLANPNYKP